MTATLLVLFALTIIAPRTVRHLFTLLGFCVFVALVAGSSDDAPERTAAATEIRRSTSQKLIYLSDLLRDREYRFAYNGLFDTGDSVPTWMRRFNSSSDGVQLPVHRFNIAGRSYQLARVCKPRGAGECLDVVFSMDDSPVAWGYYSIDSIEQQGNGSWIGRPPLPVAEAVEKKVANPDYFN